MPTKVSLSFQFIQLKTNCKLIGLKTQEKPGMRDQKLIFVGVELIKEIEIVRERKVKFGMFSLIWLLVCV